MQTPTTTPDTCPDWCSTLHPNDDTTHVQDETHVLDIYGNATGISAFRAGALHGVYFGNDVLPPAEARKAGYALIAAADAAELALVVTR